MPTIPSSYKKWIIFLLPLVITTCIATNASARHFRDTVQFRKSVAEKHQLVMSDSALNEIGIDSILNKIENVHNTLNRILNTTSVGYDTKSIEEGLPEIDSNIEIIDDNLTLYNNVLDVKNLQMFDVLLHSLQGQLTEWRELLFQYNKDLVGMSDEMGTFKRDTLLREILADSAFKSLYAAEITDLKGKWHEAKKSISDNLSRLNHLQSTVSNEYFTTIDLENKSHDLLKKVSGRSLGKEYDFLWQANKIEAAADVQNEQLARRSYHGQRKILHYYFKRNISDQIWQLFFGLLFFIWVFRNFRIIHKAAPASLKEINEKKYLFIGKVPLWATLVVLFSIAPFFDLHPPTAYVAIMEFFLVITLTIILWRAWPRTLFLYWVVLSLLYITFSFVGAVLTPTYQFRMSLLGLNVVAVLFGLLWFRTLVRNTVTFSAMIKAVTAVFIILNITAIFCNVYGRLSLAKIFSVTAVYSLTQMIGLSIFIQIVIEAFDQQTIVNRIRGGITAKFNFSRIENLLRRMLIVLSAILWSIVFTISLNLYNFLFVALQEFFTKERKIGSTSFQVGNILLFFVIIYISNLLQQGIGSLYGKAEAAWDPEVKKNGSRLAMTRLVLIVIGFLIAVAASGIPMDKITIVLGALGVGIGLGLQTIVNNLVSGVILIFEQPFRIGDFIELGDKKGRVLDIGIRSSKIVMEEGAEIIMPNADLLSGRVINWTLRNDNVRVDLPMSVLPGRPYDEIKQIILDELQQNEHVVVSVPPEVLLLSATDKAISINVLVWVNDVHRLQYIKSELLGRIYAAFAKNDIKTT
jgi:potassium-dependent mechanosensitive channel